VFLRSFSNFWLLASVQKCCGFILVSLNETDSSGRSVYGVCFRSLPTEIVGSNPTFAVGFSLLGLLCLLYDLSSSSLSHV